MSKINSSQVLTAGAQSLVARHEAEGVFLGLRLSAWLRIAVITVLFSLLFWPNLRRIWDKTNPFDGEANWQHGLFVPLIGLYYLYVNREKLLAIPAKTEWSGLAIMVGGILFFTYGIYPGQNDWFKDVGMVITLFGIVTFLCGWEVMKIAWFPIVFLVCALPWPGLFYSMLAGPLQKFAAMVAVRLLNLVGVSSGQFGTKIFIVARDRSIRTLNVAEACAGLRSLMTFVAIGGAVAFLSFRPLWQRMIMLFSAIPIAISCNTLRVTVQGILARCAGPQWSEEFAHGFVGFVMMIPAFFLILLVGWVLQNIFIDELADKKSLRSNYTAARAVALRPGSAGQKVAAAPRAYDGAGRSPGAAPRSAGPRGKTAGLSAPRNPSGNQGPAPRSRPEGTP